MSKRKIRCLSELTDSREDFEAAKGAAINFGCDHLLECPATGRIYETAEEIVYALMEGFVNGGCSERQAERDIVAEVNAAFARWEYLP